MEEEKIIELKKIERQLILYKYFDSPCIKMREKALSLYGLPASTIYKDMKDLTDAGLINLTYDEFSDEYVWAEDGNENKYNPAADKPCRVRHLNRLYRLGRCMRELYNDPMGFECIFEDDHGYEGELIDVKFRKGEKSCKDIYQELFPGLSARTMERDFQTLTRIGYPIHYNRELQSYEFYEEFDEEWEEYPYIYGVFRDKETGKLCRKCGEKYDLDMQENFLESIRGKRQGLPLDEWMPIF